MRIGHAVAAAVAFSAAAHAARYYSSEEIADWDEYCQKVLGEWSYCKYYAIKPTCEGAAGRGRRVPCGPGLQNTSPKPTTAPRVRKVPVRSTRSPKPTVTPTTRAPPKQGDVCKFEASLLAFENPMSGGVYFMKPSRMMRCVTAISLSDWEALWTLHNLLYGVVETYSFTSVATDSRKSLQTNDCDFQIHDVKVDLRGELHKRIVDIRGNIEDESVVEAALKERRRNAFEFHQDLLRLMNRLHDAHTLYISPFDMFRIYWPFQFSSRMEDGKQVITLRANPEDELIGSLMTHYMRVVGEAPFGDAAVDGAVVTEINGAPAMETLLKWVSSEAGGDFTALYQQDQQRLNAYFFGASVLTLAPMLFTLPVDSANPDMEITLKLANDATYKVKGLGQFVDRSKNMMRPGPNVQGVKLLESYMHTNPAFNVFMEYDKPDDAKTRTLWHVADDDDFGVDPKTIVNPDEQREGQISEKLLSFDENMAIVEMKARVDNIVPPPSLNLNDLDEDDTVDETPSRQLLTRSKKIHKLVKPAKEEPAPAKKKRGRPAKVKTPAAPKEVEKPPKWTELNGMSYHFRGNDTIVVKVPSFVPEATSFMDQTFIFFPDMQEVQLAAKRRGATRILLDLTGNGGGYVASAYALLWYFVPDEDVCSPIAKRITPNWISWLESFGVGYDRLVQTLYKDRGETLGADKFLNDFFDQLLKLTQFIYAGLGFDSRYMSVRLPDAVKRIEQQRDNILKSDSAADRAKAFVAYLQSRDFLPPGSHLQQEITPPLGWYPLGPSEYVVPRGKENAGKPFDPPLSQYTDLKTEIWGERAQYSSKGEYSFCPQVVGLMPQVAPRYSREYWQQVAFVTDGTCGSACSMFSQNLQLSGRGVAFSYGASANGPVDVSSFAGGNVEDYETTWRKAALAAKLGELVTLGRSPWARQQGNSWQFHPVAFPTKARARFNWNMMFAPRLGDRAMPRQFYLIPAHKHLQLWAHDEVTRKNVYDAVIAVADWELDVKRQPQFIDSFGGRCIPHVDREKQVLRRSTRRRQPVRGNEKSEMEEERPEQRMEIENDDKATEMQVEDDLFV